MQPPSGASRSGCAVGILMGVGLVFVLVALALLVQYLASPGACSGSDIFCFPAAILIPYSVVCFLIGVLLLVLGLYLDKSKR